MRPLGKKKTRSRLAEIKAGNGLSQTHVFVALAQKTFRRQAFTLGTRSPPN
jgi:hypothetical protein